jgi:hypothetical protein
MADRAARDAAIPLIEMFRDGRLTNDRLEDAWPRSEDHALLAISHALWLHYDDHREHVLTNPSPELVTRLNRCIDFLRSDLAYEWPVDDRSFLKRLLDAVRGLPRPDLGGDEASWPFFRPDDVTRSV